MSSVLEKKEVDLQFNHCQICKSSNFKYLYSIKSNDIQMCADCKLQFINPQPSNQQLSEIYSSNYFLGDQTPLALQQREEMKRATARLYLQSLVDYGVAWGGKLLEV